MLRIPEEREDWACDLSPDSRRSTKEQFSVNFLLVLMISRPFLTLFSFFINTILKYKRMTRFGYMVKNLCKYMSRKITVLTMIIIKFIAYAGRVISLINQIVYTQDNLSNRIVTTLNVRSSNTRIASHACCRMFNTSFD